MTTRMAQIGTALVRHAPDAMGVDEVRSFLSELVAPLAIAESSEVALAETLGRVLAQDIVTPLSVPPHDNSAMDGYAFDGTALAGAAGDLELRVVGTALAGAAWRGAAGPGDTVRIMTGAMMPAGLDTVVPQELCTVADGTVRFAASSLRRGANRRLAGEDLTAGRPALRRGDRITPAGLGLMASLGLPRAPVLRRLRVACFSTGDEILSPGDAPREGAIYDSNRYVLIGLLARLGCEVIDLGLVRDAPEALEATLRHAAEAADVIVTSGGVSIGEADHTRAVMQRLGDVAFWGVAMRPGRPMAVGLIPRARGSPRDACGEAAVLFGLPGNPVAVMVSFLVFVKTALLHMLGCNAASAAPAPLLRARSVLAIRKKPGRTEFQRGFVHQVHGALPEVRVAANQGSGVLSSMAQANGLVVLHHDQGDVAAGGEVDVMMFDGAI